MSNQTAKVQDSLLGLNLNEMAHTLLRELATACKKASIYGPGHPVVGKAIEKPYLIFEKIFGLKKYVNCNLQNGHLFILNIRLKSSVFNQELVRFMQIQDVNAILFQRGMTMNELGKFVDRFVQRTSSQGHGNSLGAYLKDNKVDAIEVNSEKAYAFFEQNKQYRGDVDIDFTVENVILGQLGDDLETISRILSQGEEYAQSIGLDYDYSLVQYLIPEKIASIPSGTLRTRMLDALDKIEGVEEGDNQRQMIERSRGIFRLADYHPERSQIISVVDKYLSGGDVAADIVKEWQATTGAMKLESTERIDKLLDEVQTPGYDGLDVTAFIDTYSRLIKVGQKDKVKEAGLRLVESLNAGDASVRQKSLDLLGELIRRLNIVSDTYVYEHLIDVTIEKLNERQETFEYSELIWQLWQRCFRERKFFYLSRLMSALAQRCRVEEGVTIFDSVAVKKVYSNINQLNIINNLVNEMIEADFKQATCLRDVLIAIGSEEVAMALSNIISHPRRQVRQQALRILGELGKASLKVFSQILVDDSMFEREPGRYELPDNKWYIVRNSIFVLGLLQDSEATVPLRLRINDDDVRVRREIIATLEKIGGEEATDLLVMMADDPAKEIRDSAVITIGLIGRPDMAPVLIDLARINSKVVLKAIYALGKLGGPEAESFLVELIEDEQRLGRLANGEASREDIKLAVIKALGQIGNDHSLDKLKNFKDSLSATQKIFFRNSPVNKAIEEILSKHPS